MCRRLRLPDAGHTRELALLARCDHQRPQHTGRQRRCDRLAGPAHVSPGLRRLVHGLVHLRGHNLRLFDGAVDRDGGRARATAASRSHPMHRTGIARAWEFETPSARRKVGPKTDMRWPEVPRSGRLDRRLVLGRQVLDRSLGTHAASGSGFTLMPRASCRRDARHHRRSVSRASPGGLRRCVSGGGRCGSRCASACGMRHRLARRRLGRGLRSPPSARRPSRSPGALGWSRRSAARREAAGHERLLMAECVRSRPAAS